MSVEPLNPGIGAIVGIGGIGHVDGHASVPDEESRANSGNKAGKPAEHERK